jgi:ribosomal protein S18 acetylase RimI-like enzyme
VLLNTDSNTGALGFYQHLGFEITRSFTHWAVDL